MTRALGVLLLSLLAVLPFAGSANAARGQTLHFRFHGTFAEAGWSTGTSTSSTDAYIAVQAGKRGTELFLDRFSARYDADGNFLGGTEVFADVTSGFTFTIDKARLTTAQVSASNIPATRCTYDQDFDGPCVDTTVSASASWTGDGPISHETFHDHFRSGAFSENDHFTGTARNASASGTIGSRSFGSGSLNFADMGTAKSGSATLCIGNNC